MESVLHAHAELNVTRDINFTTISLRRAFATITHLLCACAHASPCSSQLIWATVTAVLQNYGTPQLSSCLDLILKDVHSIKGLDQTPNSWLLQCFALTSALSRCAQSQRGKVFQARSGRAQRDRALVSATTLITPLHNKNLPAHHLGQPQEQDRSHENRNNRDSGGFCSGGCQKVS